MADELNRRNFLKAAAIAAGPAVISAQGANDKVNIGWIGVGTRGYAGLDWLHTAAANEVQITAICDTYQGYIARAQDRLQTVWGNKAKTSRRLPRAARRQIDRRRLHHDAGAPAPRYDDRGAQGRQARLHRKAPRPHHRRGLRHHQGLGAVEEDRPGGHAEPQFVALQEGERTDPAGHGGRRPFRARLLVSQRAAQRAVLALRDSRRGHSAEYRLEPLPGHRAQARLGSPTATSSGASIGITRAASPPICWCTRPTS